MKSKGVIALESHIEKPAESTIFQKYPKVLKDHFATDFICDTLRMMTMNLEDPHQIEDAMEKQLEKHHHEGLAGAHALQQMADGLPALGIVAAVLGVIKTMGSITEPPEVLGGMIGGALVGTFAGYRGATVVTCVAGDRRGNVAVGKFTISVALVRTVRSASALFAPQAGARVRGPSVLRWRAVRKARFYNVQVYRNGRKILSRWPKRPRMRLGRSWTYQGRRFRLKRGVYVWYVWPAFGVPANPRYGKMLGKSSFRVA